MFLVFASSVLPACISQMCFSVHILVACACVMFAHTGLGEEVAGNKGHK